MFFYYINILTAMQRGVARDHPGTTFAPSPPASIGQKIGTTADADL